MKTELKIAVLGFGTVGASVVKMLLQNAELIAKKTGKKLTLKYIADLDIKRSRGVDVPKGVLTTDALLAINDPDVDVIVEVIGGVNPAKKFIETALKNKKHVVTSNKEVLAKHGQEFIELATQNNVNILFEASVGGGIPIINALAKTLAGNNIKRIFGIMNGTTNYILTKMYQDNAEFAAVLKEAQTLGYAEADPANDVDGYDAAYKLAILAGLAFNSRFDFNDIYCEGIRKISAMDITLAKDFGYVIKLLAIGIAHDDMQVELRVHPVMVPANHPLASVNDSFNAVFVEGDCVGETMFYGRGAGVPTASAVVGDLIDLALHYEIGDTNPALHFNFMRRKVIPVGEIFSKYFIRIRVKDEAGVLAAVAKVCADNKVSIKTVHQKNASGIETDLVIITHAVKEAALQKAIKQISALSQVIEVSSVIRAGL